MIFFDYNSIKYCYIHIPKTAGISFQNTILKYDMDNKKYNLLFNNYFKNFKCKNDHVSFSFIKNNFIKEIRLNSEIKYFTIVRNPWKRMASLFEQIMLRDKVGLNKILKSNEVRNSYTSNFDDITYKFLNDLGFYDSKKIKSLFKFWLFYIGNNIKILPNFNPNFNVLPQSWWFLSEEKNECVDEFYLFENIASIEKKFDIKLSHDNKKKFKFNFKDYYDQESIDYIANLDSTLIKKFNYDYL